MSLMRWSPMGEIESMRRRMSRLVEEMIGRHPFEEEMAIETAFIPAVDVYLTDTDAVVTAELPGLDIKDVSVEVSDDRVILGGEMRRSTEVKEENFFRSERSYGSFRRIVTLPERVKEDQARATFDSGVLTIRAPLAEPAERKAHRIPIQEGQATGAPGAASSRPE